MQMTIISRVKPCACLTWLCCVAFLGALFPHTPIALADLKQFECHSDLISSKVGSSLLHKVALAYQSSVSFRANFMQESYLAALDTSEQSSGEVIFLKPAKMRWDYLKPDQQHFVMRDNTLWLYQPVDHQIVVQSIAEVLLSDLPLSFMLGLGNIERDFVLVESCKSAENIVLHLAPQKSKRTSGSDDGLKSLDLLLAPSGSGLPIGARIRDITGNLTAVVFSQLHSNIKLEANNFELQIPSGVDIDDRRPAH